MDDLRLTIKVVWLWILMGKILGLTMVDLTDHATQILNVLFGNPQLKIQLFWEHFEAVNFSAYGHFTTFQGLSWGAGGIIQLIVRLDQFGTELGNFRITFPFSPPSFYLVPLLVFSLVLNHFIVTTPTQPQLNSKVGCDTKMTLDHHHHHKLYVINISAVPDPIFAKL